MSDDTDMRDAKYYEELSADNWAKIPDEQFEIFCREVRPSLLKEIRRRCEAQVEERERKAYFAGLEQASLLGEQDREWMDEAYRAFKERRERIDESMAAIDD